MSYIKLENKIKKKIGLVDCNSFYVSCERLFNPKIQKLPVVVLSNNDGCVISRSNEAKQIGIKMGEPYFKIKQLVKNFNVQVFSSNYALYGDISRRVMMILKKFSPSIEFYSIDEAFLDLSQINDSNIEKYIFELRATVLKWTGIPVSIGVASTKTLSKIANHIAKKTKNGTENFIGKSEELIDEILQNFLVEDIWGIGRQIAKLYKDNNIQTAFDLKHASNSWIKKNTNVLGLKTVMEVRGISCIDLDQQHKKRKNCCVSRSFGNKVKDFEILKEAIISHCLNAAEKIRLDRQVVKSVVVFIRNSPFHKSEKFFVRSKKVDLPISTDDSIELSKICLQSLKEIFIYGPNYKKAGVMFCGLSDKLEYDENLFSNHKKKLSDLMLAIDKTNFKFGRNAITVADTGFYSNWRMRKEHSSKIDTSSFDYLPTIKTG